MVWCSPVLLCQPEIIHSVNSFVRKSRFLDKIRLHVSGGPGGSGYPKIMGVGGCGGNVYLEASEKASLSKVLSLYADRRVKAGNGGHSAHHMLLGKAGHDVTVKIPLGVTVVGSNNKVMADLLEAGERILVAAGGEGGNQKNAYCGRKGQQDLITLYLKMIADIGFVGFPNAGKSTLLRALSRARPRVANYPFTTIKPNVGIMEYSDSRQISCADLPGLIEGAHKNVGLGHSFLRHVERTSLLLFVVDIQGFQLGPASVKRDPYETVMSLNKELELYDEKLLAKPAVLVVNKMDTEDAKEKLEALYENLESDESYEKLPDDIRPVNRISFRNQVAISAREQENVEGLKENLRKYLDDLYEENQAARIAAEEELSKPLDLRNQLM